MSPRHALLVCTFFTAAGCASLRASAPASATASLRTATGSEIGTLRLDAVAGGVRVSGQLTGLTAGAHGIHFHAVGRCDAPDFASAGPHFNPAGRRHGLANPDGPHAGDMPAIAAGTDGRATVDFVSRLATLDGATNGLLDADGTAIVVHAANDDQRTDPAGNSGARVACGLVVPAPTG